VSEALFARLPEADEGTLSKLKAFLVSRGNLARTARRIGLGEHLRLGATAETGGGRDKDSFLADALEAVIAAVQIDGGDQAARRAVQGLFGGQIAALDSSAISGRDFKTRLQEELQAAGRATPRYRVGATEGPPHRPVFHVDLLLEGKVFARGRGGTKKEAEQRAARVALRRLRSR
jgi:ribonuclease-3